MKRDMDLIRTILLKVEADPSFNGWPQDRSADAGRLGITGHDDAEVTYHLVQAVEAGLLEGNTKMAAHGVVMISKLTPKGHHFLDDIRDVDVWHKTKERAKGVANVGISFVWEIAKAEIKAKLGLP
jgi:hypothetical protein